MHGLLAIFLEPPLFFLSDRYPRRWFVCGGLAVLGLSCFLAAAAPGYWWLFAALLLFGPASGCGVTLSQATLIDGDPENAERWMTRWTLAGCLGDFATPALLAVMAALRFGWRGAFVVCGGLALLQAALLWRHTFPDEQDDTKEDEHVPWREAIRLALGNRTLIAWSLALLATTLLDEILVAFATLRMTRDLSLSDQQAFFVIACLSGGAAAGLFAAELALDRWSSQRLLVSTCLFSVVAHLGFVLSRAPWALAGWAVLSGIALAFHYPLAKARLYRALPGRSGTAVAVAGLWGPLDLLFPVGIGLLADRFGYLPALLLLLLQPLTILVIAIATTAKSVKTKLL